MYQLRKIDLGTVALFSFLMYLILSLIFFLPFGIFMSIITNFLPDTGQPQMHIFRFFGGIFIVLIPIFYAVVGTIINVIISLCYNLLSIKLGGIRFSLEKYGQVDVVQDPVKAQ
jgi:hypothetical protein